ncbi:MAG: hypothetical protein LBQ26_00575 [Holosporales bacterium]|nr:hypothetical protein [Holosporales bacterium]
MRFIFDWTETFADTTSSWRGDEDPFAIEISQAEGEFAVAHVTLLNPQLKQPSVQQRAYARIAFQKKDGPIVPLFCGRVITLPIAIDGALLKVELIAEPDDAEDKLRAFGRSLRVEPYWDPLFVASGTEDMPNEALEARTALFAWHRVTGALTLSDLYHGQRRLTIEKAFKDTVRLHRGTEPWDAVDVTIEAQWVQRACGCVDLAPIIAHSFPGQMINTYSGRDFEKSWHALAHKLRLGGYEVLKSTLEEVLPPETGILNLYPRRSPVYLAYQDEEEALNPESLCKRPVKVQLKRYWFKGKLLLAWHFQQKRQETAHFVLKNRHQLHPLKEGRGHIKRLHFKLRAIAPSHDLYPWRGFRWYKEGERVAFGGWQYRAVHNHRAKRQFVEDSASWEKELAIPIALGDPSRASFFTTRRGQKAVVHAIARARSYLAASSRSFEVSFRGPFEDLADITIEDAVVLKDPRLPGGAVCGKVIKTRLVIDGKTQTHWGEIRIACGVGLSAHSSGTDGVVCQFGAELYAEENYAAPDTYQQTQKIFLEGLEIEDFSQNTPMTGFASAGTWDERDLIESMHITNLPVDQENFLASQSIKTLENFLLSLKACCTTMRINLRRLHPKTVLTHQIPVTIQTPWSAPKGVTLSEDR